MHEERPRDILIYGWHPVFEALDEGKIFQTIWIESGEFSEQGHELWARLKGTDIPIKRVPKMKLDRLVKKGTHQGVVAFISPVEFVEPEEIVQRLYEEGQVPRLCFLDGVTDVRNLGAIARSAACFGIHGLILPVKHSGQVNAEVVKSSAGGIFKIALSRVKDVLATLENLKNAGLQLICLSEKAEESVDEMDFSAPCVLVFGAEGKGIRSEILEMADAHVGIDMTTAIDSLNVSVSAGIVFHQIFKSQSQL